MVPRTCPPKKIPAGQHEEVHGVAHHGQEEHYQPYLLRHYQNASIQDKLIQYRKDQMQVSNVDKDMG